MGAYVDTLQFARGSFSLMPFEAVKELIDLCHSYDVMVSTGGFIEHVLTQGPGVVDEYISACHAIGFDIIEVSSGFITMPTDDLLRVVEKVQKAGMKAKNYGPEMNLFVDHSQIVQLECLRSGIWGTKSLWGRVLTYK